MSLARLSLSPTKLSAGVQTPVARAEWHGVHRPTDVAALRAAAPELDLAGVEILSAGGELLAARRRRSNRLRLEADELSLMSSSSTSTKPLKG